MRIYSGVFVVNSELKYANVVLTHAFVFVGNKYKKILLQKAGLCKLLLHYEEVVNIHDPEISVVVHFALLHSRCMYVNYHG